MLFSSNRCECEAERSAILATAWLLVYIIRTISFVMPTYNDS